MYETGDETLDLVGEITRDELGLILSADMGIAAILGWRPEQIVGLGSIELIHPDDQPSALAAWLEMLAGPGSTRSWRGRYRASEGRWRWVQTVNSNRLQDVENPVVETVMRPVAASQAGIEEELRASEQLLRRLSEALPVGIFQVDCGGRVVFTNDRLHEILGVPAVASVDEQFAVLVEEDRPAFQNGLAAVLAERQVDDLELRFKVKTPHPEFTSTRVCQASLRVLTDSTGLVTGAIGCLSDTTDSVELRRELQLRASTDGLTGCLNRSAVFELLDLLLSKPAHPGAGVAVIFIDLDRFKEVNDSFGHATGDQVLCLAAERIRGSLRGADSVGRLGGDEFLVVCPDMPSVEAAAPVARRVNESLDASIQLNVGSVQIGASLGLAWARLGTESPDALIARADRAMYQSKLDGAGAVTISR